MRQDSGQDAEAHERVALLSGASEHHEQMDEAQQRRGTNSTSEMQQSQDKASSPSAEGACSRRTQDGSGQTSAICRICLEEDEMSNLESPCGCTGTQRWAHHDCIQRWVSEKGNTRCEICEQPYRGQYNVPPPPPQAPGELLGPLHVFGAARGSGPENEEDDAVYPRTSSVSWCFTFILFFMFLIVLHHTLMMADGVDGYAPPPDSAAPSVPDPSDPSGYGPDPAMGAARDDYAASLTFFMFWVATKAFLIGVPLYTVMRVAARQAQREQYEVFMRRLEQHHAATGYASRLYRFGTAAVPQGSSGQQQRDVEGGQAVQVYSSTTHASGAVSDSQQQQHVQVQVQVQVGTPQQQHGGSSSAVQLQLQPWQGQGQGERQRSAEAAAPAGGVAAPACSARVGPDAV